ncbi:MAG: cysteine desulfurase [Planctomycetota bacterium]|nr:MAG: cysteine desulfurase [Planctomycetota bacterium]
MSIYLDWNATTPPREVAINAWAECQRSAWGNPASIHSQGQAARHHWDQARAMIGKALDCRLSGIVFTSGGTEANNLAIHAALHGASPGTAVASAIDHSSILRPLEQYPMHQVQLARVDGAARIDADHLRSLLDHRCRLVCLQFANNETGTLQDLGQLVPLVRAAAPQAHIHCDAAQGAGKTPLAFQALGVDTLAISAHKFGGPKGAGALLCANPGPFTAQLYGGGQQQNRRSGTEDVAGALAMAYALDEYIAHMAAEIPRQRALLEATFARCQQALPQLRWLAQEAERLANTCSLAHPGVHSDPLTMRLDLAGIACSRGSACMAAKRQPSHVVSALGLDPGLAASVLRLSIGPDTTAADLDAFAEAYIAIVSDICSKA